MAKLRHGKKTYQMRSLRENDTLSKGWKRTSGFYELRFMQYLASKKLNGVYVDVGANVGNHSVFFANHCECTHLVAVEAHPEIADVLRENLENNEMPCPYDIMTLAVGENSGEIGLSKVNSGNCGMTHVVREGEAPAITVPMKRLDEMDWPGKVALIKIDVENYELEVVKGASGLLASDSPVVTTECRASLLGELSEEMHSQGYSREPRKWNPTPTYIWTRAAKV